MNYFSHYPYQNFSDYNLDWLMKLVKEVNEKLSEYLENSVITFADPITWDITEQYTALTCVVDSVKTHKCIIFAINEKRVCNLCPIVSVFMIFPV